LRTEYTELIDMLTDDEAGVLLKAVMQYVSNGEVSGEVAQLMDTPVEIMFALIRRDNEERVL
jgi:hypothetical protein